MKAPPSQVLVLSTADSTVFLGPPGAWGMSELGSVAVLDKPVETFNDRLALDTLEGLKRDDWQVAKLRNYLAGPAVTGYGSVTVRTTRHDAAQVFGSLRTHLRSHRLRAVVIHNHERSVAPSVAQRGAAGPRPLPGAASAGPTVSRPGTLPRGGSLPAVRPPANVAGWSTRDRLMALLHDTLPLLGPGLRAHIAAMTSTEAMAHLLAGMALMAGLQVVPVVGEAADAVFLGMAYAYAGWDGLRAVVHLVQAVRAAVAARSEAEIAHAAPGAAEALITLGGAFLDAMALRMAKRSTSGGGTAAAGEEVEQTVNLQRGQGVGGRTSTITENARKGRAFEQEGVAYLKTTQSDVTQQVSVQPYTPSGDLADYRVRLDAIGRDDTDTIRLTDFKSSTTAGLTQRQTSGYPLLEQYGGEVVGNNGLAAYPAGFQIPPTHVDILTPGDF